jgi:predicted component of type VI protein secretion system
MAQLIVKHLNGTATPIEIMDAKTTIGRDADNLICLEDPRVSAHHAAILEADGKHILHDLNSSNGTKVNGETIVEFELHDDDILSFGDTECFYKAGLTGPRIVEEARQPQADAGSKPAGSRRVKTTLVVLGLLILCGAIAIAVVSIHPFSPSASDSKSGPDQTSGTPDPTSSEPDPTPSVVTPLSNNPELAALAELLAEPIESSGDTPPADSNFEDERARTRQILEGLQNFQTDNNDLLAIARQADNLAFEGGNVLNEIAAVDNVQPDNWDTVASVGGIILNKTPDKNASFQAKAQYVGETIQSAVKVIQWVRGRFNKSQYGRNGAGPEGVMALS